METQKIRKLLEMADKTEQEPECIFRTDSPELFIYDRVLREITVGGKELLEYVADELIKKPPFIKTDIAIWGHELRISIPGIDKSGRTENKKDLIATIDIAEKTYRICDINNAYYRNKPELTVSKPDEFWQRLENLTVKKRFANIRSEIHSGHRFRTKFVNCLFWLVIGRKKADKAAAKETERIQAENERNRKYFEEELKIYEGIQKYLPGYIAEAEEKQKEIAGYLGKYGYKEVQ